MKIYSILISHIFIIWSTHLYAETHHFTNVVSTNTWVQFAGHLSINQMNPENGQDEVAVFVDDGNGGELIVGATTVGTTNDNYYLISIFGDDTQTAEKDGAVPGDILIFKVWHNQSSTEQTIDNDHMNSEIGAGLILPDLPPVFGSVHGEQFGYLNLQFVNSDIQTTKVVIPTNSLTGLLFWMCFLILMSVYLLRHQSQRVKYKKAAHFS